MLELTIYKKKKIYSVKVTKLFYYSSEKSLFSLKYVCIYTPPVVLFRNKIHD